jgi:hypothetical protein
VLSGKAQGSSPQQVALNIQNDNFSDYQQVYDIPGAEIGYQSGYGSVWDEQVSPFFGLSQDTRLVIVKAVRNGVVIALVGSGPATSSDSGRPDPSGLPLGSFVDNLINSVSWSGSQPL